MAQSAVDKIPPGPKLDALTAEKVFGWKKVHKHQGALLGRKQDKAGRWRQAKVPNYSTNPLHSYSVENRMKQLGRMDRYQKELSKISTSKNIPLDWATPDQRCRAAIKAVGHSNLQACTRAGYQEVKQEREVSVASLRRALLSHYRTS